MKKLNLRWRWLLGLSFMCGLGMPGLEAQAQGMMSRDAAENTMVTASAAKGKVVAAMQTADLPTEKVARYRRASKSAQTDTVRFTVVWEANSEVAYPMQMMLAGEGAGVIDWGDGTQANCSAVKDLLGSDYVFAYYEHYYTERAENDEYEVTVYTSSPDLQIIGLNLYAYTDYDVYTLHSGVDVRFCPSLKYLYCTNNWLGALDLTRNTALTELAAARCRLTALTLPQSAALKMLGCGGNQLTSLDVSGCSALTQLYCWNNQLTSLDVSACPALDTMQCQGNRLGWATLDELSKLNCSFLTISPQTLSEKLDVNGTVDLTAYQTYKGENTVFDFSEMPESSYVFSNGRLQIKRAGSYVVHMSNPAVKQGNVYINYNLSVWPKVSDTVRWVWTAEADISREFSLMLMGDSTFWVQWGDGDETEYTLSSGVNGMQYYYPGHIYKKDGDYEVKVYGATSHYVLTGLSLGNVSSLDVRACPYLTSLSCNDNQLTSLDLSKNTALTSLSCNNNQLTSLDLSKNTALTSLSCYNNQLTSLDLSKNTALRSLYCNNNRLTSLDVSENEDLAYLYCNNNQLTSLDLSKNTALTFLDCYNNQLTSLDVSQNAALTSLSCYNNQLTSLNVRFCPFLQSLYCHLNRLTSLDVSENTALELLYCNDNRLTSLDVSKNVALKYLECSNNRLTSMDVSLLTGLEFFGCYNNSLEVTLDDQNAYDLSTLPGLDVSKIDIDNLYGGTLEGSRLTFMQDIVYYSYQAGYQIDGEERPVQFSLRAAKQDEVKIPLTAEYFPDDIFRAYLARFDRDGNDSLGEYERIVSDIDVQGTEGWSRGIKRLDGLRYFENLSSLNCSYNDLTSLDVSENENLHYLYCDNNYLTSLDISKNENIYRISCKGNRIPLSALADMQANAPESVEEMTCTPQYIPVTLEWEQTLDLKSEMQIKDKETQVDFGTVPASDYTFKNGKLQFKKDGTYRVQLTNDSVKSYQYRYVWVPAEDGGEGGYTTMFVEDIVKVFYDITAQPAPVVPDDPDDPDNPDNPNNPDDPNNPDNPDKPNDSTANEAALTAAPFAYVQGRTVYFCDGLGEVEAFTAVGQRVYRGRERAITIQRPGVYVLRVVADGRRCKIIVR